MLIERLHLVRPVSNCQLGHSMEKADLDWNSFEKIFLSKSFNLCFTIKKKKWSQQNKQPKIKNNIKIFLNQIILIKYFTISVR